MPKWMAASAVCALLCGSAYADDRVSSGSNAYQNGADRSVNQNTGSTANRGYEPIHDENKQNTRYPDFSIYGRSIVTVGATDPLPVQKLSGFSGSNATAGTGSASGKSTFLLRKEHDAAIRMLTTNIALRFKLSADGVHLNLAF